MARSSHLFAEEKEPTGELLTSTFLGNTILLYTRVILVVVKIIALLARRSRRAAA
jgi:hypothetical protein